MKINKSSFLFFLALFVPAFLVFKELFSLNPLAWGDSHHLFSETLKEFLVGPQAWTNRENNFGGINGVLWLYPFMAVAGFFNYYFGIGYEVLVRLIFYFPAVFLSFLTPFIFVRSLNLSRTTAFFTSLLYGLNTYFLLLVDGGQAGVFLAYSLFPLALLSLRKTVEELNSKTFLFGIVIFFLITIADPRIAVIALTTIVLWYVLRAIFGGGFSYLTRLKGLALVALGTLGLSSFWLVPLLGLGFENISLSVSSLRLFSFINPLFLFQPHWPGNQFGVVSALPAFFLGIPILIFGSFFLRPSRKLKIFILLILFFSFLVKGETPPLGGLYSWVIANLPFASAFRDSSKFLVPVILFGGILIGSVVDRLKMGAKVLVYLYLLALIYPAISGNLSGVLKPRQVASDFGAIYERLKNEQGSFRTLWFPERSPFTFQTEEKPALDAKSLVKVRPFASMNVGSFDLFNFMHDEKFVEWLDLLGIKYLIFSGDPRKEILNKEDQKQWDELLALVEKNPGLEKVDWRTEFPIYKVPESKQRIFAVDRLTAVVGPEPSVVNQTYVFFEDGKFDPKSLLELDPESVALFFNDKEKDDLVMSFLQGYFVGVDRVKGSDWAKYSAGDYLEWKYQLLFRGLETKDFDYGQGVAFSSVSGERMGLEVRVETSGRYLLAVRGLSGESDKPLKISINGKEYLSQFKKSNFGWFSVPVELEKGKHNLVLENTGGMQVVNVVALIPEPDWKEAEILATGLTDRFDSVSIEEIKTIGPPLEGIDFEKINPTRYKVKGKSNWLVFSDSYHFLWKLRVGDKVVDSLPFYSMVNGFYVGNFEGEVELVFEGQKYIKRGAYFSLVSLAVIALGVVRKRNNV